MDPRRAARFIKRVFKTKKSEDEVETALKRRVHVQVNPKNAPGAPSKGPKSFTIAKKDKLDLSLKAQQEKRLISLSGSTCADKDTKAMKSALSDAKDYLDKPKDQLTNKDLTLAKGLLDHVESTYVAGAGFDVSSLAKLRGIAFDDESGIDGLVKRVAEEISAQNEIIAHLQKTAKKKKSKQASVVFPTFPSAMATVGLADRRKQALLKMGKEQETAAKAAHKAFEDLLKDVENSKDKLRAIYVREQQTKLEKEVGKDRAGASQTMGRIQGMEFFENLQIVELKCEEVGFNPYKGSSSAFKKGKGPSEPMEMGEVAAIFGYSTQDFTKINGKLRAGTVQDSDGMTGDPLEAYVTVCRKGLRKLPVYKGEVWRADPSAQYFLDELAASGTRSEKAFLSTAISENLTAFGGLKTRIVNIKTGREISQFSLYTKEKEVLFPDNSKFRFVSFTDGDKNVCRDLNDFKDYAAALKAQNMSGKDVDSGTFVLEQVS